MTDPKWFVGAGALAAIALVYSYSFEFGVAASALFAVLAIIYLWISIRLAPSRGEPVSERAAMFSRFARLARNRRSARLKELGSGPIDRALEAPE